MSIIHLVRKVSICIISEFLWNNTQTAQTCVRTCVHCMHMHIPPTHMFSNHVQYKPGLNSGRVKTHWEKIDTRASIRTNTVHVYCTCVIYIECIYSTQYDIFVLTSYYALQVTLLFHQWFKSAFVKKCTG